MSKTIFITGSTNGIGKLAAIKFAQDGHRIILHGRSPQKLQKLIAEIKTVAQPAQLIGFTADFADLGAVRKLGEEIKTAIPSLDILINNAGIFKSAQATNKEGLDIRMVVNYLAPYLLTESLLPLLAAAEAPQIINLSSAAQAPVSPAILRGTDQSHESETYAQSKLALTMWSFHLAKQHPDIAILALNPGSLLNTRMVQEAYGRYWSPADKGANIIYDLAVGQAYQGMTGKYYDNDRGGFGPAHADAYDEQKVAALIKLTEEMLSKD
ncbi:MAG: SDR family NAD(P)-dependent oxidoreductase [Bacteroidota bacterium]